ncbi:L,D-transpeptidase family protein [Litorisediminicola beolgyonensis]|uniref:Murein L,D-transpeptidase n=1 Tax=Litorisediminicola beolgyonensis TaxID=1173614 RepID=A0ABW3ZG03_9RHOB
MTMTPPRFALLRRVTCLACFGLALVAATPRADAQISLLQQTVAEATMGDESLASFYRDRGFEPLWAGADAASLERRSALLAAMAQTTAHGLPSWQGEIDALLAELRAAQTLTERGRAEVAVSRAYLKFARALQTGILEPGRVVRDIRREVPYRSADELLMLVADNPPRSAMRKLSPATREYARLMREKFTLERRIARGGWGPQVPSGKYERGMSGPGVIALRNRLIAMDYLAPTARAGFDSTMHDAVELFQADHGLIVDGIVGGDTLRAMNVDADERLRSVLVAMERERWMNLPGGLGKRHIRVNLPEFMARVYDDDKLTFETRAVIGARGDDRESPEFSDEMEHMVVNPSWYVPRSIVVNEYLPLLRQNPYSVGHIEITDSRGRRVNRAAGFSQYGPQSFPFSMRQPPGPKNALGQVKFMFPNRYNIYLHDTPSQHLFADDVRAYSHGCIRLDDPYDLAYVLLAPQSDDPKGLFQSRLRGGRESRIDLETHVPVHLMYRTAYTTPKGHVQYRHDIYGRDAAIWRALERAGVSLEVGRS